MTILMNCVDPENCIEFRHTMMNRNGPNDANQLSIMPPGINAIYSALTKFYPRQTNPLQITAKKKWWLGGTDPLDFVSIYINRGDPTRNIPPHWHYVSMGFSDLYGDGRVYQKNTDVSKPSGQGYEFTFRLLCDDTETDSIDAENATWNEPPVWPAAVMQQMARWAINGSRFSVGEVITWHAPLDGFSHSSGVRHLLLVEDAQLQPMSTQNGFIHFIQLVGIFSEEVTTVQRWNGREIARLLRSHAHTGGLHLITNMNRRVSMFEIIPNVRQMVNVGIIRDGSSLTGIHVNWCHWREWNATGTFAPPQNPVGHDASKSGTILPGVEIFLTPDAALSLPLMVIGRLGHGRWFSFIKSSTPRQIISFLSPNNTHDVQANAYTPYVAIGFLLQVYVCVELQQLMRNAFKELEESSSTWRFPLPREYPFPTFNIRIIVTTQAPNAFI